jgi:flagellar FliJ protein
MAQFEFALEALLTQRQQVEQNRQRELARAQVTMREAEDELRQLDQAMQTSLADIRQNRLTGKLDLGFLAAYRRYVASVQRKGTTMVQKMALIQRQIDTARQALNEAAKQRKIMEKLREKHLERWRFEESRKEAAELDEVNTRMVGWKLAEEAAKVSE